MASDPRGPIESGRLVAPPKMEPVTNYPPPLDAGVLDAGLLDAGVVKAPLAVAVDPFSLKERHWVQRVACLGGSIEQTVMVLFEHRYGRPSADPELRATRDEAGADPREYATYAELDDMYTLDRLRVMVGDEFQKYDKEVHDEFESLTSLVRDHFKSDAGVSETFNQYQKLRPMYCSVGIDHPKSVVFDKLVMSSVLGKNVVVHEEMKEALKLLAEKLDAKVERTSNTLAKEVTSADGFHPRLIANTNFISNHSLGLAIDINAPNNPHIVDKTVIALIKDITKTDAGPEGFDFGKALVKPEDQQSLDDEAKRQQKIKEITEIHVKAQQASDLVRDWLTEQLEREKRGKFDLSQLAAKVNEWRDKIKNAANLAEAESYRYEYEQAERTLATKEAKFNSDGDRQRLEALRKLVGEVTLQFWAREGIRNLPLDLVLALVVDLHFEWGDEWEKSKDGMHFDFLKNADGGVIIPKKRFMGLNEALERGPDGI